MLDAATTAFVEAGIYQRLECGCTMHAHAVDPCGPCLCVFYSNADDYTAHEHTVAEFLPIAISAQAAYRG